ANLENVDLSGKDLTGTILDCLSTPIRCQDIFTDTNLQNTNLTDASFVSADLTKIKNKSLAGADLSGASFAHSNLSDVNMSNVILDATNFWNADLTGQGLTVIYDVNTLLYHFNNLIQKIF
ncbi:pentapeptide repeat-containing protein, partial [Candidatus Woesearchaeota archaeon]|nr:pentapeptide repeat-containing protein [Candidatus Woesearchaeota archaeon]